MHQQINLYQPIFREERKLFSLKTVSIATGVIVVALLGMWGLGARNVAELDDAVSQLRAQQASQEQSAQRANEMLNAQGSPAAVEADVQRLSALLAERTNALNLLRSGAAGESRGFAPRLAALARQRAEGVWLEELVLGGGEGLVLRGRSVDAERVPKYLQLLTQEPELAGARFDQVVLDRRKHHESEQVPPGARDDADDSGLVRFSVASSSMAQQTAADGRGGS